MRPPKAFGILISTIIYLLLIGEVHLQSVVAQNNPEDDVDEPTCSIDPSAKGSECASTAADGDVQSEILELTRHVISLTDDNFDQLTLTSTPATWLIMFKTNACAICKKAQPIWEELSIDVDIAKHNDRELATINDNHIEEEQTSDTSDEDMEDSKPTGPVYVYEESTEEIKVPKGPIYIATIDAGWTGRDITKQFNVDATPTIILLRNEGYNGDKPSMAEDPRSYYIYRGQRTVYPLRKFVFGEYAVRKQVDMPPPLLDEERKPKSYWGQLYDYILSPTAKWSAGLLGKFLLAWFVFIGGLGLFMRIHNYAWGDNADDDTNNHEQRQKEIEEEKAKGREEYEASLSYDEKSIRRQKAMWEQKAKNRAKFVANREARAVKKNDGDGSDDEKMEGVGFSVKKADTKKNSSGIKKNR